MKTTFFLLIFGAVFLESIADTLFKKWALENQQMIFFVGVVLYLFSTIIWAYSLKYEQLSKAIVVYSVFNLLAVVFAGIYFFGEQLTFLHKIGVLFGIAAVVLLQL